MKPEVEAELDRIRRARKARENAKGKKELNGALPVIMFAEFATISTNTLTIDKVW